MEAVKFRYPVPVPVNTGSKEKIKCLFFALRFERLGSRTALKKSGSASAVRKKTRFRSVLRKKDPHRMIVDPHHWRRCLSVPQNFGLFVIVA